MNTKKLFVFVGAALFLAFANVAYSSFFPAEKAAVAVQEEEINAPQICGADAAEKSCADLADVRGNEKGMLEEYVTPTADEGFALTSEN